MMIDRERFANCTLPIANCILPFPHCFRKILRLLYTFFGIKVRTLTSLMYVDG